MSKLNHILLIDDDPGTNHYHRIIMEDMGIANHIQFCSDGQDALDYLTKQGDYQDQVEGHISPDLIFIDINMPGLNGFEFLDAHRKLSEEQKGGKIIMLSTSMMDEDKAKAESYPEVSEFSQKPLTEAYLKEVVAKYQG